MTDRLTEEKLNDMIEEALEDFVPFGPWEINVDETGHGVIRWRQNEHRKSGKSTDEP